VRGSGCGGGGCAQNETPGEPDPTLTPKEWPPCVVRCVLPTANANPPPSPGLTATAVHKTTAASKKERVERELMSASFRVWHCLLITLKETPNTAGLFTNAGDAHNPSAMWVENDG